MFDLVVSQCYKEHYSGGQIIGQATDKNRGANQMPGSSGMQPADEFGGLRDVII
jgi:hypothetical protein